MKSELRQMRPQHRCIEQRQTDRVLLCIPGRVSLSHENKTLDEGVMSRSRVGIAKCPSEELITLMTVQETGVAFVNLSFEKS